MKKFYTIGHSNRKLEEFLNLLKKYNIEILIDVRRFPKSKKFPWFNKEVLEDVLNKNNIKYVHLENLGGFRKEGYEKYIKTYEFRDGFKKLLEFSKDKNVCIMCAEKFYWKCHRKFIINELKKHNIKVINII